MGENPKQFWQIGIQCLWVDDNFLKVSVDTLKIQTKIDL